MPKLKERRIWFYTCAVCGKARRQSHKKQKARDAICKVCKKNEVPENQQSLFDNEKTMYKTFDEAMQDPKFSKHNVKVFLDADQIEQLEWKETTKDQLPAMKACVDFIPAKMYPEGFWHESGELGHDLNWRYFTHED